MVFSGDCNVCGKPGRSCARCMSVSYCSKKHQTVDWAHHRPSCTKLFQLVQDEPSKSPYLVATRTIERGTKIMSSRPIAIGPVSSESWVGNTVTLNAELPDSNTDVHYLKCLFFCLLENWSLLTLKLYVSVWFSNGMSWLSSSIGVWCNVIPVFEMRLAYV